uniref:ANK_REP_REGION domain-containing protein n=1 Tax=Amphora coffeiformis TaxID=265554 RepID=A0A7S3LFX1_9STRA
MTTVLGGRIPASLQAIFTASNKGEEVYVPPTDNTAFKVYGLSSSDQRKPILFKYASSSGFKKTFAAVPPQAKFHLKLKERGYFPRNYASKRSGYHNQPTEHQLASYGSKILQIVKQNDVEEFRKMLEAGLSPNACNEHGESLLHMVCRHGKVDLFRILLAFDVDLQQTDDYGRTPMHDCAWAANPSFEIAKYLLQRDPNFLYLFDARGSLPLSYVTKPLWGEWNTFLVNSLDSHFPKDSPHKDEVPILCTMKPNSRPVPDPKNKIAPHLAKAVAMGEMSPYEAIINQGTDDDTYLCSEIDSDDSSYYSDEDSDFDSDEEEELHQIVGRIGNLNLNTIQEY